MANLDIKITYNIKNDTYIAYNYSTNKLLPVKMAVHIYENQILQDREIN